MRTKRLVLGIGLITLVSVVGVAGWFTWRWQTTPSIPAVAFDAGVDPWVVDAVMRVQDDVRRQPRSGEAWGKLAMTLDAHRLWDPAFECYRNAQRFDPEDPRWPYLHGRALIRRDRQGGIELMRMALARAQLPSDRATILFRMALEQIELGQLDEAEEALNQLRLIDDLDSARTRFGFGLLAVARNDRTSGRELLTPLVDHVSCRKRVSRLLATLAEPDRELVRFHRERSDRLPDDEAWPDRFGAEKEDCRVGRRTRLEAFDKLKEQGRHKEALDLMRTAVAEIPDAEVCYALGYHLLDAGEVEEAIQAFRKGIGFDRHDVKLQFLLGEALMQLGEQRSRDPNGKQPAQECFGQALDAFDRAIRIQEGHADAHRSRGLALKRLDRPKEAIAALRQANNYEPTSSYTHLFLGEMLAETGQVSDGIEHLEIAVRLAGPNDPRPQAALEKWRKKQAALIP